jgi:hypothetical protein
MKTKHTPGPWLLVSREVGGAIQIVDSHPATLRICTVTNAHNDEANAHLIAAAPELLKQLESALACIERDGSVLGDMVKMRAAIAKAKGEQ